MESVSFSDKEINELKGVIVWAIEEGCCTNETTKELAYKLKINKETMKWLDRNCNIGKKLI